MRLSLFQPLPCTCWRIRLCVEICLLPVHAVAKEDVQWAFDLMKEAVMEL